MLKFAILGISSLVGTQALASTAFEAWEELLEKEPLNYEKQEECEPRFYEANPDVSEKGTVVFLHGYTACPQQYFDLAEKVAAEGYNVALPLLPGHGKWRSDAGKGGYEHVPTQFELNRYDYFVRNVNKFMAKVPGKKIIGGLSLGGSMALRAVTFTPNLYDAGMVMTPLLELQNNRYTIAMRLLAQTPLTRHQIVGWGEDCEITETQAGRAGICEFKVSSAYASEEYGKLVSRQLSLKSSKTRLQFVGVEGDLVVQFHPFINAFKAAASKHKNMCLLPYGSNHSLLSPYDTPHEDKFWIPGLHKSILNFIKEEKFFPKSARSKHHKGYVCRV